ncbi:hypothetical protein F4859DRAFT_54123 [Xylaria cf. heliscus]|nr:hypothetical protein F4859DRAFT_54123 [Xylaria cf. heliscus]
MVFVLRHYQYSVDRLLLFNIVRDVICRTSHKVTGPLHHCHGHCCASDHLLASRSSIAASSWRQPTRHCVPGIEYTKFRSPIMTKASHDPRLCIASLNGNMGLGQCHSPGMQIPGRRQSFYILPLDVYLDITACGFGLGRLFFRLTLECWIPTSSAARETPLMLVCVRCPSIQSSLAPKPSHPSHRPPAYGSAHGTVAKVWFFHFLIPV